MEQCEKQPSWNYAGSSVFTKQFNHADSLRLRNTLVQMLEELKQRRKNDVESEERIKMLVQEKYELERKKDSFENKMKMMVEEHQKHLLEAERSSKEKCNHLLENLKQHEVYEECMDTEMASLKDQIRNLQLRNYTLEKSLRDQERKLQLEVQSSEKHLQQMSRVEQEFLSLREKCKQFIESDMGHLGKQEPLKGF